MVRAPRRSWADVGHHDEPRLQRIVRRSRTGERGYIPELLAKKEAEQAARTSPGYRTASLRFADFLGEEATAGEVDEAAGYRFLTQLEADGLGESSIASYFKCLKAYPRWMAKKGSTQGLASYLFRAVLPLNVRSRSSVCR